MFIFLWKLQLQNRYTDDFKMSVPFQQNLHVDIMYVFLYNHSVQASEYREMLQIAEDMDSNDEDAYNLFKVKQERYCKSNKVGKLSEICGITVKPAVMPQNFYLTNCMYISEVHLQQAIRRKHWGQTP